MQTRMRAAYRRNGDEPRVTSIDYALIVAMFAVSVPGSIVMLKGLPVDTEGVIATAVTAAAATALAMVS